jgi:hypothetical protein
LEVAKIKGLIHNMFLEAPHNIGHAGGGKKKLPGKRRKTRGAKKERRNEMRNWLLPST